MAMSSWRPDSPLRLKCRESPWPSGATMRKSSRSANGLKFPYAICCIAFDPKPWKLNTAGTARVPSYAAGTYSWKVRACPSKSKVSDDWPAACGRAHGIVVDVGTALDDDAARGFEESEHPVSITNTSTAPTSRENRINGRYRRVAFPRCQRSRVEPFSPVPVRRLCSRPVRRLRSLRAPLHRRVPRHVVYLIRRARPSTPWSCS